MPHRAMPSAPFDEYPDPFDDPVVGRIEIATGCIAMMGALACLGLTGYVVWAIARRVLL
jgi:hypothetical protein